MRHLITLPRKWILLFAILQIIIIIPTTALGPIPSTTADNATRNATTTHLPTSSLSSTAAIFTTTNATKNLRCFYGINASDTSQFVEVCVDQSTSQLSFDTTKSDIPTSKDIDRIWILITAAMVFLMQCGFSLFEAGMVQSKNVQSVLYKNLINACISAIGYYLFGFCLSYGKLHSSNRFLGVGDTVILSHNWDRWFYEWTFSSIAITIASCALTERTTLFAYIVNALSMVWWIYPIIVHWLWSATGWLSPFYNELYNSEAHVNGGAIDFAGSCVVHIVGGCVGLAGAILVGPRVNRFENNNNDTKKGKQLHYYQFGRNLSYQIFGCLIIWFGFYGFTCGRTLAANNSMFLASKIAVNTTLSAAMACITVAIIDRIFYVWKISTLCNGILVGLVSISASCAVVEPWMAIIIGCVGGIFYMLAVSLELLFKIDDPLTIWPTFGIGGFWGMVAVGFFGYEKSALRMAGYDAEVVDLGYGMRWGRQFLAAVIVSTWAIILGFMVFGILRLTRTLRVDKETEERGLDHQYHDEQNLGFSLMSIINKRRN